MVERIKFRVEDALRRDSIEPCSLISGSGRNALDGAQIRVAGACTGSFSPLAGTGAGRMALKGGFPLTAILMAGLLFASVGWTSDLPTRTPLTAGSHATAPQETKWAAATAMPPRSVEKSPASMAPDFTLSSLDGSTVTLGSFKGKKGVVLVFFATWCVKCMGEVPDIKKFALAGQKENVEVLAINFKQRGEVVEKFYKSNGINYRILLDKDGTVTSGKYGIKGLPHMIGIDAKGEMIYRGDDLPANKAEFMEKLNQGL